MRRITTAILLGAAVTVALAPLLACEDDTTVNTAFKDAGTEGGEAGEAGEAGHDAEAGTATDAADDGG
jgi:hypothetical protein